MSEVKQNFITLGFAKYIVLTCVRNLLIKLMQKKSKWKKKHLWTCTLNLFYRNLHSLKTKLNCDDRDIKISSCSQMTSKTQKRWCRAITMCELSYDYNTPMAQELVWCLLLLDWERYLGVGFEEEKTRYLINKSDGAKMGVMLNAKWVWISKQIHKNINMRIRCIV